MRHSFLVVGVGLALVFSACSSDSKSETAQGKTAAGKEAKPPADTPVNITNFLYEPQDVVVPAGTAVTWTNKDSAPHNVQDLSDLNTPISKDLNTGETFSITYPKAGIYPYVCSLHPFMTGNVKVT